MTIRLLMQYRDYPINSIISLDAATESGLILAKMAEANLTGGLTYIKPLLLNQKYNAEIQLNPNTGDVQGLVNPKTGGIMRHAKTRIIASFGGFKNQGTQFSNATTQLSATDRVRVIPWADANNIQAVMINGSSISNGKISAPGNAVMIAVSIEMRSFP